MISHVASVFACSYVATEQLSTTHIAGGLGALWCPSQFKITVKMQVKCVTCIHFACVTSFGR